MDKQNEYEKPGSSSEARKRSNEDDQPSTSNLFSALKNMNGIARVPESTSVTPIKPPAYEVTSPSLVFGRAPRSMDKVNPSSSTAEEQVLSHISDCFVVLDQLDAKGAESCIEQLREKSRNSLVEVSPDSLLQIYKVACELFLTQKITTQNAFSIKLLECITEILKLDTFASKNMQEFARILEIGGKIYVCRVESTHSEILKLASSMNFKVRNQDQSKNDEGTETDQATNFGVVDVNQKRKKVLRKKRRHIKPEESIQMDFNFARRVQERRTTASELFDDWVENDEEFDYDAFLHRHHPKPEEEICKTTAAETKVLKQPTKFSLHVVNSHAMSVIIFYPFYLHKTGVWNSDAFDIWGRLLPGFEPEDFNLTQRPGGKGHHFEYITQTPVPDVRISSPSVSDNFHELESGGDCEDLGGYPGGGSIIDESGEVRPIDINKLNSIKQIQDYYQALRRVHLFKTNPYDGWEGPVFSRPSTRRSRIPSTPRQGKREDRGRIDFGNIDWKDVKNKYHLDNANEEWTFNNSSHRIYFPNFQLQCDDELELGSSEEMTDDQEKFTDPVLRYMVDRRRTVLDVISNETKPTEEDFDDNQDLDNDNDNNFNGTELDRESAKLEMLGLMNYPQSENLNMYYSNALKTFANCFPNPVPGQPNTFQFEMGTAAGLHYVIKPKPIDMKFLKNKMVTILSKGLNFNPEVGSLSNCDTSLDFTEFMQQLMEELDERTRCLLSPSLVMVALLHVIVENKFRMETINNHTQKIICPGNAGNHLLPTVLANNVVDGS